MQLDNDFTKLAKMPADSTDGLFPIFHHEVRQDDDATEENNGVPVYKSVEYVEIIAPGNDKERINRRVKQRDKDRWPVQYAQFKEGREEPEFDGMPISEWPMANKHIAMTLKHANVFTVEQLAQVPDIDIQSIGQGMIVLKSKAQKWVKEKQGQNVELENAKKELGEARKQIEELEELFKQKVGGETQLIVKSGSWYTYGGKKYRKADLPDEIAVELESLEK